MSSEVERSAGFVAAMAARGLEPAVHERSDFSFEGGYKAGLEILQNPYRPDAMFCGNDAMALGLMNAARETLGLRVPEDVAIIGFDDIAMAKWPCFRLSTVRNPVDATVDEILSLLESRFADPARRGKDDPDCTGICRTLHPLKEHGMLSIWLVPQEPELSQLRLSINGIARIAGGPTFEPHVTILADVPLSPSEIVERSGSADSKAAGVSN